MGRGRVMGGAVGRPAIKTARNRYMCTIIARKKQQTKQKLEKTQTNK
jgi:hypothetical protein